MATSPASVFCSLAQLRHRDSALGSAEVKSKSHSPFLPVFPCALSILEKSSQEEKLSDLW